MCVLPWSTARAWLPPSRRCSMENSSACFFTTNSPRPCSAMRSAGNRGRNSKPTPPSSTCKTGRLPETSRMTSTSPWACRNTFADKFREDEFGSIQLFSAQPSVAQSCRVLLLHRGGAHRVSNIEGPAAGAPLTLDLRKCRPEPHGQDCDIVVRRAAFRYGAKYVRSGVAIAFVGTPNRFTQSRICGLHIALKFDQPVGKCDEQGARLDRCDARLRFARLP
jgi:hypothetical protein